MCYWATIYTWFYPWVFYYWGTILLLGYYLHMVLYCFLLKTLSVNGSHHFLLLLQPHICSSLIHASSLCLICPIPYKWKGQWYVHKKMVGKGTSKLVYTHSLYCVYMGMLILANQKTQRPTAANAVKIIKPQWDCSQ